MSSIRHKVTVVLGSIIFASDSDGAQCNGDFVAHPSSTVCQVNLSNWDPSIGGWVDLPNDAPVTIAVAKLMHASKIDSS